MRYQDFINSKQILSIDAFNKLSGGGINHKHPHYSTIIDLKECSIDKVITYDTYYYIFLHKDGEYSLEVGREEYIDTNLENLEKILYYYIYDERVEGYKTPTKKNK
tara:strand:- start:995 stop:1312 length:318 start_codon:yes stop_codon:yes gene_type:complete